MTERWRVDTWKGVEGGKRVSNLVQVKLCCILGQESTVGQVLLLNKTKSNDMQRQNIYKYQTAENLVIKPLICVCLFLPGDA